MCNSESEEEKLRKFRKLQRLAWAEGQAKQQVHDHSRHESADQTINQSSPMGSPSLTCSGDPSRAGQQSSLPSRSSESLSLHPSDSLGGGGNFYLPPAMCPLPLPTHTGLGQPMVAGPVFLPPCFPVPIQVPIQGPSLPEGYSSYRFPSSPQSPTSPPSLPVESQDVAGRLLPTGQDRPSSIPEGSGRSSRTVLCDQGLPSVQPGGGCLYPTPNKRSRLELLLPVEVALLP